MNSERIKEIENIFRNSTSSDELFDAFQEALRLNLRELEIFKILLANLALSTDEVKMFTEKLLKQIPESSFDICMWTAKVFGNYLLEPDRLEDAVRYYSRAISHHPSSHESQIQILNLYNYEIEVAINQKIIGIVESTVQAIDKKSKVYYALADHYKRIGNLERATKYLALAEKSAEREKE